MATISELNVRLGLLYKDFDKSLGAVERRLERSGRKFSQLGNDLALSISLPLAAIGASAIKQAGEIESLKLAMVSTFKDAGRSAAEATKEVDALREAAKAPGLDFEQAIRGSVRLQGVGLAAEEARSVLIQMANAIALTGGTADDLDGVTRQFAQMIAKGRVLQEDVSILAERMPKISDLMQQAFGTRSVEAIRNMGVSGKEFVERITAAASGLERVEGGIKNALVNAGAEARQSLAALGEAIIKAFDVTGKIEMFTKALSGAVNWFKSLDDSTQSAIVSAGAFLIAAGPMVKILGSVQGGLAVVVGGFRSFASATKSVASVAVSAAQAISGASETASVLGVSIRNTGELSAAAKARINELSNSVKVGAILYKDAAQSTLAFGAASTAAVQQAAQMKDVALQYIAPIKGESAKAATAIRGMGFASAEAVAQAARFKGIASNAFAPITESAAKAAAAAANLRFAVIAATGGLAAIVLGIAAAVYAMSDNFDAAKFAADKFSAAQKSVTDEAKGEVAQLNKNIDTLKDVRSSTEDRKKAADALLEAYPNYLRGIDLEKASLSKLTDIQEKLTVSIVRGIAERKKAQAVNAVYEKQADILLRIQEIQRTGSITAGEATLINTGDLLRNGSNAAAVIEKLKMQVADLGKQADITARDFDKAFGLQSRAIDPLLEQQYKARAAAEDARDAFLGFGDAVNKSTEGNRAATDAARKKAADMAETYRNVEKSIDAVNKKQAELGADFVGEKTREIEAGVEKLIEAGFSPDSAPVQKLKGYLKQIRAEIAKGFGSNTAKQAEIGVIASAPTALPSLALPTSVASIDTSQAQSALNALKDLNAAAVASMQGARDQMAQSFIANAEKERIASQKSNTSIAEQIKALKQQRLTAISDIERAQIDAQMAELERIQAETAARGQAQMSVLNSAMDLANGLVSLQQAQGEAEKAKLDEEYGAKLEAAKGNADAQAKIQAELAAKKKAIDKKIGKEAQGVAIAGAIINTALGVSKALSSAPPPYNFVLAALTAAAGAVQIATIKSQKFADGGVIKNPTFGLMGEYPGAQRNPEIVTPERLMRSVFREEMAGGGGPVQVYGVIKGADIVLSSERAAAERNRTR